MVLGCLLLWPTLTFAQLPTTTYGWNLGNTMEPPGGVGTWNNPAPTQALINEVAAAGFNTIRIPCAWASNADRQNNISPTYMAQVKQVVDWSRAAGLTVVLNNHNDGGWFEENGMRRYDAKINTKLQKLWTQIANTFKNYDNGLLFACANEVFADGQAGANVLRQYYQNWVNTVRATGGNNATRWLIVQGPYTNIDATYNYFSLPTDPTPGRLAVEVHFYDPWQYTGMSADAAWGYMWYFWGNGYHTSDPDLLVRNVTAANEESWVAAQFQKMQAKFVSQGIPVLLGEFGCARRDPADYPDLGTGIEYQRHLASRTYYNKVIVDATKQYGLKAVFWDNGWVPGGALFERNSTAVVDPDGVNSLTGGPAMSPP